MDDQQPYPAALRAIMKRAEEEAARWNALEASIEAGDFGPASRAAFEAFVTGRAGEVMLLVNEVIADWTRGALSCDDGVKQLEEFLAELDGRSLVELLAASRHPTPVLARPSLEWPHHPRVDESSDVAASGIAAISEVRYAN